MVNEDAVLGGEEVTGGVVLGEVVNRGAVLGEGEQRR